MFKQTEQPLLEDADLAYIVLADLKRVVREYTTAATESVCPNIRQLFTDLMNSTLTMQGQLFKAMEQAGMYSTPSHAMRQEVDKQLQEYQQTQQQTQQMLQQKVFAQGMGMPGHMAGMSGQQNKSQPAMYN